MKVKTKFCFARISRENDLKLGSLYRWKVQKKEDKQASLIMLFIKCQFFG